MILFTLILLPFTYLMLSLLITNTQVKKLLALIFATVNLAWVVMVLVRVSTEEMLVVNMGSWPAPYGITLAADRFSAFMLVIAAFVFLLVSYYSSQSIDRERRNNGHFFYSFGILMGVNGSFSAGDIFNLYVWFEVMLISSFILMGLGGERKQLEGSIKYLILNLIGSMFFLAGIGLLYGKVGTLNMADIASRISLAGDNFAALNPALILIVVGFSIKGALFPFFFWLPASYHTPPPAVTALFAGLLTKVGIYSLIRIFTLFLFHDYAFWSNVVFWMGGLSMVVGVIAASAQMELRKILAFHIISQSGYMAIALGFFTEAGIAAAIFFTAHNMLSKTNAFLVAGWVHRERGTLNLKILGDMFQRSPLWGVLFFISAFSLAGLPPLSGFFGKFMVLKAGVESRHILISMVALFVGLITLFSMVKIWLEVFWKLPPSEKVRTMTYKVKPSGRMLAASTIMACAIIAMGLFANSIGNYCTLAARDLLNPQKYISYVLENK